MCNNTCEDCFYADTGICFVCVDRFNVCRNCIWYGEGQLCDNCVENDDEGIDIIYIRQNSLDIALDWIEWNTRLMLDNIYEKDYEEDYEEDYDY
jgi:hypothetical protein